MSPEVTIEAGRVRGETSAGIHRFLGVPYAAAPFGPCRFGVPEPTSTWEGVRDATSYAATAPQPEQGFTIIPEPIIAGDDCLNVNVFTPQMGAAARLPVLVWIHGGGFVNGCNASAWYDGRSFARDGIVVVAINYRLGIEGFLPIDGAPTNRAVLDWIAALEWVKRNVGQFGGDPSQVTIGGQSAGGVACATLLTIPRAQGLFRAAIMMSGAASYHVSDADAARVVAAIAEELGVPPTRGGLGSVDRSSLLDAQQKMARGGSGMRFGPIFDGDLVPGPPLERIKEGVGAAIPVVVGSTRDEVERVAAIRHRDADAARARRALERMGLRPAVVEAYLERFGAPTPWRAIGRATTDTMFRMPAVRLAEARIAGGAADSTYVYEFQWQPPTVFGACHCLDVPFAFDVLDAERVGVVAGEDPPPSLTGDVHGSWVRFIKSGDPGWPPYNTTERPVMAFDAPRSAVVYDAHQDCRELAAS